ncbi:MAG: hypothetical protein JSV14_03270 [Deltaproteobacteria bacterium]|jgi:hypothetical protein|nr:MAG: hypothetical protein JSV14_03270 [Deltaproteobacteria bacterium]
MNTEDHHGSAFGTWIIVILLVLLVLAQGAFSYLVVGDLGQPDWEYRQVRDVPGESPYAIYEPLPYPQHIKGQKGE